MKTVTPDTIVEEGEKKLRKHERDTRITSQGFVLETEYGACVFVGFQLEEPINEVDTCEYAVAKSWKEEETIGREEPRIETSKNTHLECKVYRMELPPNPKDSINDSDEFIKETIAERIDEGEYKERILKGWINGHRLPSLETQIRDNLKYK